MTSPVSAARPQPITKASALTGVVATLVAAAVFLGVLPAADGESVTGTLNVVVPSVVAAVAAVHTLILHFTAQRKVTPADDPHAAVVQPDGTTVLEPMVAVSLATNPNVETADSAEPFMEGGEPLAAPPEGFDLTV